MSKLIQILLLVICIVLLVGMILIKCELDNSIEMPEDFDYKKDWKKD